MSNRAVKPHVVLDFRCDQCGKKLDCVVVARDGTQHKIAKAFHEECWKTQQTTQQPKTGVN